MTALYTFFKDDQDDPYDIPDPETIGNKAANIYVMRQMGLLVPEGFVLPTEYTFDSASITKSFLNSTIRKLADDTDTYWNGGDGKPLIVSVRSGAPVSMPGMMDTILNVGLTRNNLDQFTAHISKGNKSYAYDSYRRLISMYGTTVMGIEKQAFDEIFEAAKIFYLEFDEKINQKLLGIYEKIYERETGEPFPDDVGEQLYHSVHAVFASWHSERAIQYRDIAGISHDLGTAATVQRMVFGNIGDSSGTGVAFSHNPNTGERGLYGDFLQNAQGEDVVSGAHKTLPIVMMRQHDEFKSSFRKLQSIMTRLLAEFKHIQDIEFTIEDGTLYILQCRTAKCTRRAYIRYTLEAVREGILDSGDGSQRIMDMLPKVEATHKGADELGCVGKALGVIDGIACGAIAIGRAMADKLKHDGVPYIYVAKDTAPEDVPQMQGASGILTAQGGSVSHAAIIARSWEICCVVGFDKMEVLDDHILIGDMKLDNGSLIKIDGATGEVYA